MPKAISINGQGKIMDNTMKLAVSYIGMAINEKGYGEMLYRHDTFAQTVAEGLNALMVGGFVDYGAANFDQKIGLPKLLEHLSEHKIDYVIIPYLDMLSSDEQEQKELTDKIEKTGTKIISVSLYGKEGYEQYSDLLDDVVFVAYFETVEKAANPFTMTCNDIRD